jgi:putative ABC transport system permease protein
VKVKDSLAWLQLTREKPRFITAIAGITFACVLIFMQLGFLESLYVSSTRPHQLLNADLVLAHPRLQTFFSPISFPRQRLYQALGYQGVETVTAVRIGTIKWRNPLSSNIRSILVFGIDPAKEPFALPDVIANAHYLKLFNRILFDRLSRPEFGPIAELLASKGPLSVELNSKAVKVAGLFSIGASFAADGNAITSDTTFNYLFGKQSSNEIDLGLIKLAPEADKESVKRSLQKAYGNQVQVYSKSEFAEVEKKYWAESTGIGFIFTLGVFVGFIVGIVIVYQILYSDVADHLSEYATLKAIGFHDNYLLEVLALESVILALVGFIPAFLISIAMYFAAAEVTALPVFMTWQRAVLVFALALSMCVISGAIASRKLRYADPADVF